MRMAALQLKQVRLLLNQLLIVLKVGLLQLVVAHSVLRVVASRRQKLFMLNITHQPDHREQ